MNEAIEAVETIIYVAVAILVTGYIVNTNPTALDSIPDSIMISNTTLNMSESV